MGPRSAYPDPGPRGGRRRAITAPPPPLLSDTTQRRISEFLLPASVIFAGVLLVVAFGFIINRAMHDNAAETAIPLPQPPALGTVPLAPTDQGVIPLPTASSPPPSPSASASARSSAPTSAPTKPPVRKESPPPFALDIGRAGVPSQVDLSGEGRLDWVHWGLESTFSLERDKDGGFAVLEGAPVAPRFRHALSPERFSWDGGSPVATSDGTPTGIRTCGKGNGFTLTAPAERSSRTLKLYVGALAARGRLEAKLSTGGATEVERLEQRGGSMRTAVFVLTYRAPKDGTLSLTWTTEEAFNSDCGGVALQAATLR